MLNVIMLSVAILNVIVLRVMAPPECPFFEGGKKGNNYPPSIPYKAANSFIHENKKKAKK
jgi:hypothetical protein